MLTRNKARKLKRDIDEIPLPRTSRRPRKTVKRATAPVIVAMPLPVTKPLDNGPTGFSATKTPTAGERIDFIRPGEPIIIDTGINPYEQIKSRSINPVQESKDKRMINEQISACFREALTRNNVGNFGTPAFTIPQPAPKNIIALPGDNIPLVPLDEIVDIAEKQDAKPWARWRSFLRNGLIMADSVGEPTNEQYEKAWAIWNHILQRTNVAVKVSGPATGFTRANGPVITLLMRDHRGGEPNSIIMDSITDPDLVHIQAYKCRFGFLERDVTQYLREDTVEKALTRLRNVGWNDTPEEEKKHELYQSFY